MNSLSTRLFVSLRKFADTSKVCLAKRFTSDGPQSRKSSKLRKLLENVPPEKINERDARGWTALMLAAKEGEVDAIELLLDKGAAPDMTETSGHTAHDISVFWRHVDCAKLLKPAYDDNLKENFFAADVIQRNSANRKTPSWVEEAMTREGSEFVLMFHAEPLVTYGANVSPKAKLMTRPSLLVKSFPEVHHVVEDDNSNVTYLGSWAPGEYDRTQKQVTRSLFAVDVSGQDKGDLLRDLYPGTEILAPLPGFLRLRDRDAAIVAQARSVLDWQTRYRFCASCGSPTELREAGYKRVCSNNACSSHKGESSTAHPRVDPTIITAVVSRDNEHCLLGRQKRFPSRMYSCLAGFVEPGESVEQACRREVYEEVGVYAQRVQYHSSQPWPTPSSLMIGCMAHAEHDTDIKLDEELEDARWFTRQEVVMMMMTIHPEGLFLPPIQAIAHHILKDWLFKTAFDQ